MELLKSDLQKKGADLDEYKFVVDDKLLYIYVDRELIVTVEICRLVEPTYRSKTIKQLWCDDSASADSIEKLQQQIDMLTQPAPCKSVSRSEPHIVLTPKYLTRKPVFSNKRTKQTTLDVKPYVKPQSFKTDLIKRSIHKQPISVITTPPKIVLEKTEPVNTVIKVTSKVKNTIKPIEEVEPDPTPLPVVVVKPVRPVRKQEEVVVEPKQVFISHARKSHIITPSPAIKQNNRSSSLPMEKAYLPIKAFPASPTVIYLVSTILPLSVSGYTIRTHEYIIQLMKQRINVLVVCKYAHYNYSVLDLTVIENVNYYVLKSPRPLIDYDEEEYFAAYVDELEQLTLRYGADFIHACGDNINPRVASEVAKRCDVKTIYEVREFSDMQQLAYDPTWVTKDSYKELMQNELYAYKAVDYIVTGNSAIKSEIMKLGCEVAMVLPPAVDTDRWTAISEDGELSDFYPSADKVTFGYIGSIHKYEGLDILIRAVRCLLDVKVEVRVIIVGNGSSENETNTFNQLTELVRELQLRKHVYLVGQVRLSQVPKFYSIIDVMVYPRLLTRYTELSTPYKVIEAMSMEKAIIVSNIKSLVKCAKDGRGMIHAVDNYVDLADKMRILVNDPGKINKMSDACRAYAVEFCGWSQSVKNIMDMYSVRVPAQNNRSSKPTVQEELITETIYSSESSETSKNSVWTNC